MRRLAPTLRLLPIGPLRAYLGMPLFRNAYALIFSAATTSALGMLYWVLAARYYTSSAVGLNAAAISAMTFLSGVSRLYLDGALVRFIPRTGRAAGGLVGRAYLISEVVSALAGLLFILGIDAWSPTLGFLKADPALALWFVLATMAASIFALQDAVLTGLRQTIWVPIENTGFALAKIALLVLLAGTFPQYGLFASWTVPVAVLIVPVSLLIFGRLIPRHVQATPAAEPIEPAQIAAYAAGNYLGYLFHLAYTRLLPIVVINQAGSSAGAYFYLPWTIAGSLQLVTLTISQSLTVEGARNQDQLRSYVRHALAHTAQLLLPVVGALVVGAPYILRVFGPDYAAEGATLLRLLALSLIPNMVCILYFGLERVRRRIARIVVVQAALALLTLGLSSALLPRYGIAGVGLACLAGQSVVALALVLTRLRPVLMTR